VLRHVKKTHREGDQPSRTTTFRRDAVIVDGLVRRTVRGFQKWRGDQITSVGKCICNIELSGYWPKSSEIPQQNKCTLEKILTLCFLNKEIKRFFYERYKLILES